MWLDTSSVGSFSSSYDFNFTDDQGTSQTLTLNLSGAVAETNPSNASFAGTLDNDVLNIDFGSKVMGDSVVHINLSIHNLFTPDITAFLDLVAINVTGDGGVLTTDLGLFEDHSSGDTESFKMYFDTSSIGSYDATFELLLTDDLGTDQTLTINIMGDVIAQTDYNPDLIYDYATGEVFLDATDMAGGSLQAYNIKNAGGGILNGNFTSILGGPPATSLPTEIGEFQLSPTVTPLGGLSIGNVFPSGMLLADLENFVTGGSASPAFGGGTFAWDLIVINQPLPTPTPEPSTYALALIGLLALGGFQRRRRR